MILHTVAFRLKHAQGSEEEKQFLKRCSELGKIPNVIDFKVMRQVGSKNDFSFGLTMNFASEQTYQDYNNHPDHLEFVNDVWLPQVEDFLEVDYVEYTVHA